MNALLKDFRFSLRLIRKQPGMTALAVAALVLGIGLNAAIFSVVNAVLLRPLPIYQPDRVVWLKTKVNQTGAAFGTSYADFLDWKSQSKTFSDIAALWVQSFTMTGKGEPEHVKCISVSANFFRMLGIPVALGRDFVDGDDRQGTAKVAILNYKFWQRKFGGDPAILGKSLTLDDQSYAIAGVLEDSPVGIVAYPDIWVTNGPQMNAHMMERDTRFFFPMGRLKPGVTITQARTEMETIAARLAAEYPATNKDMGVTVFEMYEQLPHGGSKPLWLLVIASSFIFLLATVNVMTVFLSHAVERGPELRVRLALGASRSSLMRQLFTQASVIAGIGAALGLLVAKLGLAYFLYRFPRAVIRFQETNIDYRVVLATIGMAFAASLIATLAPALYALTLKLDTAIRGDQGSLTLPKYRSLGRGAFIVFEVSLACSLSLVSGLLIKSFYELEKADLGFNPNHVISFQINPPGTRYQEQAKLRALYQLAVEKLKQLPGMESTSGISSLPLTTQGSVNTMEVDRSSPLASRRQMVEEEFVLPGFFQAMRLPLLEGRDFTDADRDSSNPVVIIDNELAAKLWPGQDPLGRRIGLGTNYGAVVQREIIGVVRQVKHFGPLEPKSRWMQVYCPQYQDTSKVISFVVNTTLSEGAVKTAATRALHEVDKGLPVQDFRTMDGYLDDMLSGRKVSVLLLGGFAATGIVLGMIGIYGAVANSVIRRRREIAIRMAVGASHSRAVVLITRLGLLATLAGIVIGSAAVMSLTRVLASFLFGISGLDPAVYFLSAVIIVLIAAVASLLPAMRLFHFNIQEILRQ